jgi:Fe-Mn family superoxide dismutase
MPARARDKGSMPQVQGEGDYAAAKRYRQDVEDFVENAGIEALARMAAPRSPTEASRLRAAERAGRARSRGDDRVPVQPPELGRKSKPRAARRFESLPRQVAGLSSATLEAHLGLYRGYLKEFNALLAATSERSEERKGDVATQRLKSNARRIGFESNGVWLHEMYFEQLDGDARAGAPRTTRALQAALKRSFGGFEAWRSDFTAVAGTRGIGWAIVSVEPASGLLVNGWIDLHERGAPLGLTVVFALDLWEHAYLADYGTDGRAKYVQAVLDDTDWRVVEERIASTGGSAGPAGTD